MITESSWQIVKEWRLSFSRELAGDLQILILNVKLMEHGEHKLNQNLGQ